MVSTGTQMCGFSLKQLQVFGEDEDEPQKLRKTGKFCHSAHGNID